MPTRTPACTYIASGSGRLTRAAGRGGDYGAAGREEETLENAHENTCVYLLIASGSGRLTSTAGCGGAPGASYDKHMHRSCF